MRTLFACCVGAVTGWLISVGIQNYRVHKLNKELEELEKNVEKTVQSVTGKSKHQGESNWQELLDEVFPHEGLAK